MFLWMLISEVLVRFSSKKKQTMKQVVSILVSPCPPHTPPPQHLSICAPCAESAVIQNSALHWFLRLGSIWSLVGGVEDGGGGGCTHSLSHLLVSANCACFCLWRVCLCNLIIWAFVLKVSVYKVLCHPLRTKNPWPQLKWSLNIRSMTFFHLPHPNSFCFFPFCSFLLKCLLCSHRISALLIRAWCTS